MEHILQYILPSILGDFIQGIDKNHMRTNFFSGKVSLQGVTLNPNLLKPLGVPVKIIYSDIGKLEVKIPWLKRLKEPIEVYLEDLLLLLEPTQNMDDFDIVEERIKFLDGLTEECTIKLKGIHKETAEQEGGSLAYYKILILDNLQLKIKNIHVRFENPKKGYSAGFTLNEVNVHTVNEKGQPEFLDRTIEENKQKDLYKRAIIKDLSFYWNSSEVTTSFISSENFTNDYRKKFLQEYILRNDSKAQSMQPILMISLESNLTFKNVNKPDQEKEPRYKVDIDLKPINITVNSDQVNQMIGTVDQFNLITKSRKYKHILPTLTTDEMLQETILYKKALNEFLLKYEDSDFKWSEELNNSKRKNEAEPIRQALARLSNDALAEASKEVILQAEKKKLLNKIEKKIVKKGFFGFWKADDKEASQSAEEMQKVEAFFDSFIQENAEQIGKKLMTGFLLQLNLTLSEASIFLIHGKSQQGLLADARKMKIVFEMLKIDNYDITNFGLTLNTLEMFFIQKYPNSDYYKKTSVMKKAGSKDSSGDFASFTLKRKVRDKKEIIDIAGDIHGTEFLFIPEIVIVMKKFFKFQKQDAKDSFADVAYEKIADLSKNAQDQIKNLISDYSSTVNIMILCGSVTVLFPLVQKMGNDSDCWVVNLAEVQIYTNPVSTATGETNYNTLNYVINKINVKYYERLMFYHQDSKNALQEAGEMGDKKMRYLMYETRIAVELKLLADAKAKPEDSDVILNVDIGHISINLNGHMFRRLKELNNCFDFSQEKEFNEYLETEKQLILKNSDGLFKVYYEDAFDLSGQWNQYIMVCSGFYLYFFKSPTDLEASKHVFIKKATLTIDNKNFDFPNVLRIKNKFEEVIIALENEESLHRLIKVIDKKNDEYSKANLVVNFTDEEIKEEKAKKIAHIDKQLLKLSLKFEGLGLHIYQKDKLVDEVQVNNLSIFYLQRPLDQTIQVDLREVTIIDYVAKKPEEQSVLMLASKPEAGEENQRVKDLIHFELIIYDEKHPTFQEKLNQKEFILAFNTLFLNWIPERIFSLIHFFTKKKTPKKESEDLSDKISPTMRQSDVIKIEGQKQYIAKKTDNKQVARLLSGLIKVKQLSVTLTSRISWIKLANVTLSRLNMTLISDKNLSNFKGSLENIQAFDLTNYQQNGKTEICPYELIGIEKGQSLMNFEFEFRDENYMKEIGTDFNTVIHIDLHSVRVNWVQQPAMRIINYVMNFILNFDFGLNIPMEKKIQDAKVQINNPKFMEVVVTANHPRVMVTPKPSSKVFFELDLGLLTVKNTIGKSTTRLLKPIPGVDFVFKDTYRIETSEMKLTKVFDNNGTIGRVSLIENFKLVLFFERCLWYEEYVLGLDIPQREKYKTLDNTFFLNGTITPVHLKFNQEDYLDIMDTIFENFAFDDTRDPIFYLDEDLTPEMAEVNSPTPIDLTLGIEYIGAVAIDQMINFPVLKVIALSPWIKFYRNRTLAKFIDVSVEKLTGSYFEAGKNSLEVYEKTLLGQTFNERLIKFPSEDKIIEELLKPDLVNQSKEELKNLKQNNLKVDVKLNNGNKDININVTELKVLLILGVVMRLKDFFMLHGEDNNPNQVQNAPNYKKKSIYRGVIDKTEIYIPASATSTVIVRGSILFDMSKYDVMSLLEKKNDFLESSILNINLEKNEIFVYHDHLKHKDHNHKRSIIYPFTFIYKSKEYLSYDPCHKLYLAKYDNSYIVDRIVLRASAVDSIVVLSALKNLEKEMAEYKKLPLFPKLSKFTEHYVSGSAGLEQLRVIHNVMRIIHYGIQIRCINDFSGVSIPILEFSLHSNVANSEVLFESTPDLLQGKNNFEISASFYNSKVSMWEPIVEKWPFTLEVDFLSSQEYRRRIDLVTEHQSLNINISDEMIEVLLTTIYDWQKNFSNLPTNPPKNKTNVPVEEIQAIRRRLTTQTSKEILDVISNDEDADVEYVSPCTIWNDTGYPMRVEAIIVGADMKGLDFERKMSLEPGEEKDLLMEWSIDRIFEISQNQSVLERMKVSLEIDHPTAKNLSISNIDIHNLGTKRRKLTFASTKKQVPLVCNVFNYKKKKLVRFSSPMIVKNSLNIPIVVEIHDENKGPSSFLKIKPHTSKGIPIDKIDYTISFHAEENHNDQQYATFMAKSLITYDAAEIRFGGHFAVLRSQEFKAYTLIYVEPLFVIKNCLPFPIAANVKGKTLSKTDALMEMLGTQDEFQITTFGSQHNITLIIATNEFGSNEYLLQPANPKSHQELFFHKQEKKVTLELYSPPSQHEVYTRTLMIAAKTCVINETGEKLTFLSYSQNTIIPSPFSLTLEDGIEVVLFDQINALKIKPKNDGSSLSDPVDLNRLGVFPLDLYDGTKKILNVAVKVTNELCERAHNLFTKVILITPRFIFYNKTKHAIEVHQPAAPSKRLVIKPSQRSPFHFSKASKDKYIRIQLSPSENKISEAWLESGDLDAGSPGDMQFICQTVNRLETRYFNLSVTLEEPYIFMTLEEQEPSDTLIQIQNNTGIFDLKVHQWGSTECSFKVKSNSKIPFAWIQPCLYHKIVVKLILEGETSSEMICSLDKINQTNTDTVTFKSGNVSVSYYVVLQGRSKIIKIFTMENKEVEKRSESSDLLLRAHLPSLRISLISAATSRKYELAHMCAAPIMFVYVNKNDMTSIHLRVKMMIVDNNIFEDAMYPVMIYPERANRLKEKDLPFLDIIMKVQNKKKDSDILYIKDFGFYMSEASFCLDGNTLNAISDYIRSINKILTKTVSQEKEINQYLFLSEEKKKEIRKNLNYLSWHTVEPKASTMDFIYIEKLAIQPIMMNLTFKNIQFDEKGSFVFAFLKKALGKALANFDRAPIRLKGIELAQCYGTKTNVLGTLMQRYKSITTETVMGIVLSSNIIGNPVKFFDRISSGFNDLVDKPVQGFLEGPIEGGIGIVAGAGSFAAKTVGATFNSLHNIADSVASGLSTLTGDNDYIQRREKRNQKENSNVLTGSVQAVTSIGRGIFGGITGVFEKPIEGGMKGGVKGFIKGVFTGTKGLVIKPVTGVLDGVSKMTEGVSNTFVSDAAKKVLKSRLPRMFYGRERIYKAYNEYEPKIYKFLAKKKPKKYPTFTFLDSVLLWERLPNQNKDPTEPTLCLWITLERIFLIVLTKKAIVWKIRTNNIADIYTDQNSVNIMVKKPTNSVHGKAAKVPSHEYETRAAVYTKLSILKELVDEAYV